MKLSDRIGRVQPSPTLAITAKAKQMKADGVDVVSFGAGEPDFDTPAPIVAAAKAALDQGKTRYTPAAGLAELRAAIAADYRDRRGRGDDCQGSSVLVSVGGKHALYNANQVLFDAGDEVIIPTPYWVSYPAMARLADATPVFVEATIENNFKMSAESLRAALQAHPNTRCVVLCSPSNPSGAAYDADELRALGAVIAEFDNVVVFFDAIYDRLYYGAEIAPDFVAVNPELADRTLTFNGFSKTYCMTGWRLGYTVGPTEVIAAMAKLQSQSTSNPTSFAQYGALAALELDDQVIADMRAHFTRRRDAIVQQLEAIDGVRCATPDGAFYVFPDFNAYIGDRFADDLALTSYLLESAHVAVVPGSAFGAPGHLRLSYATSDELIAEGVRRIAEALA